MIPRTVAVKIFVPLLVFLAVLGIAKIALGIYDLPSSEAPRRSDAVYEQKVTESANSMRDTFTISDVTIVKKHWVIVTVKSKQNSDTLRALLYDPRYSPAYIQVISLPSVRTSFDSLMTEARVSTPMEIEEDAAE